MALKNKNILNRLVVFIQILTLCVIITDLGFNIPLFLQKVIEIYYDSYILIGIVILAIRYIRKENIFQFKVLLIDLITFLFSVFCILRHFEIGHEMIFIKDYWIRFAVILLLIRDFTTYKINYKRSVLNPAQLLVISFFLLIFIGTLLLMLPKSTYQEISWVDALFTATSAACVTGLGVVDTAVHFTRFGQTVILLLIQAGGLGILTFASYFSYFFKGGDSYENQIVMSNISNLDKIGEVFSTLRRVIIITFTIELLGAVLIFFSVDSSLFKTLFSHIYYSIFHSVSAFCNAGFSTMSTYFFDTGFKYNYPLQLIFVFLLVFGGIGFPIVINVVKYFKYILVQYVFWFWHKKNKKNPWVLNINSRINLITSFLLILAGTIIIYFNEYDNVLAIHHGAGKLVNALFGATSPRTAGFNAFDYGQLHTSTILIVILLMWIGASPFSTGGGIKTSTFAVAVLNFLSLAREKSRIEIFKREISDISIKRAFATITLSLIVIGIGVFLVSILDKDKDLLSIVFECFSAYSTVGLTLGITPHLSTNSKLILVIIMFIGRLSMLSIMIAFFKKVKYMNYKYPSEEIFIN